MPSIIRASPLHSLIFPAEGIPVGTIQGSESHHRDKNEILLKIDFLNLDYTSGCLIMGGLLPKYLSPV